MTSAESTEDSAHPEEKSPEQQPQHQEQHHDEHQDDALKTLKYHLLGPSLTKAGQDKVDQSKVSDQNLVSDRSHIC